MSDLIGRQLGKFTLLAHLGKGSLGEVYRAYNPTLGREVAIKVLRGPFARDAALVARFQEEVRAAAELRHPHILPVHDFEATELSGEPIAYVVMDLAEGRTLAERLEAWSKEGVGIGAGESMAMLRAVAEALDHAHAHGLVHGGLKPSNVLFMAGGEVVVSDFGTSLLLRQAMPALGSGATEAAAYIAPEQIRGGPIDGRADVYSLGVLLYQLCTGRLPFVGEAPAVVLAQALAQPPQPPSQLNPALPKGVEDVILRALAKDPAARYSSAGELIAALEKALAGAPSERPVRDRRWLGELLASLGLKGEGAQQGIRSFLVQVLALFTAVIALLEKFIRAVNVLRNPLVGLVVVGVGVAAMVLSAGYVLARPKVYPRWQRRLAGLGLLLTLLAAAGWAGWTVYEMARPPKGLIVLVADFEQHPGARSVDYARRIQAGLLAILQELEVEGVYVERAGEVYTQENARARAAVRKAAVVIYGWYDDAGVSPRFELVRFPERYLPILKEPNAALATLDRLELRLDRELKEMSYIGIATLGLAYFADGQIEQALEFFDLALNSLPGETMLLGKDGLLLYKGSCHFYLHQFAPAAEALEQAVALNPQLYQARYNLAIAYSANCELEKAIAQAEEALRLQPESAAAHSLLGFLLARAGRWAEAAASFERAVALSPEDAGAHSSLAEAYEKLGRREEAQEEYALVAALQKDKLQQAPGDPEAIAAYGDALAAQGELESAAAEYERAIARARRLGLQPRQLAWLYRSLGSARWQQGRGEEAATAYEQAISLSPGLYTDHVALALIRRAQGRPQEAIAECQKAIALQPCEANPHGILGDLYEELGRYEEALAEYREAARLDPKDFTAWQLMGVILQRLGKEEEARDAYARAVAAAEEYLAHNPADHSAAFLLGATYYMLGQYESAISVLQGALSLRPDAATHYALASAYYSAGDYRSAAAHYRACLELEPGRAAAARDLAQSLEMLGELAEAAAAYEQALALEESAEAHAALAHVYDQLGRLEEAASHYARAISLTAPGSEEESKYRLAQAQALMKLCRSEEALQALAPLLAREQPPQEALALRAALLEAQGDVEGARSAYALLVAHNEDSAIAHYLAGWFAYRDGELEGAISSMERALALAPGLSLGWSALGYFQALHEEPSAARASFAKALETMPSNVGAHLGLGELALQEGRAGEAVQHLERALSAYTEYTKALPDETRSVLIAIELDLWAAYERAGELELAQAALGAACKAAREAASAFPSYGQAQYQLALCFWASGDDGAAQEALRIALACDRSLQALWQQATGRLRMLRGS